MRDRIGQSLGVIDSSVDFLSMNDKGSEFSQLKEQLDGYCQHKQATPELIVVDTLARNMDGNENDTRDMSKLIRAGDRLKTWYDSAVLWVHHTGKDEGRGMRGSSALRAALETEISITSIEEYPDALLVSQGKQKDEVTNRTGVVIRLQEVMLGLDDEGEAVTSCVIELGSELGDASGGADGQPVGPLATFDLAWTRRKNKGGKGIARDIVKALIAAEKGDETDDSGVLDRGEKERTELEMVAIHNTVAGADNEARERTGLPHREGGSLRTWKGRYSAALEKLEEQGFVEIKGSHISLVEVKDDD
jgi:hypothetical protein